MYRDGCHDLNWPHERPSLERLRGQFVCSIRTVEVGVTSNYLLNPCWLIMTTDIDDRDQCLPGQSIVRRSVGVKATAPLDLFATLKIVLVDWRIDDRDRCLQGQSIVAIVISINVITDLVRIALLWVINVMLVDHTEISTDRGDGL